MIKMKKNGKKTPFVIWENVFFFLGSFLAALLALHFKDGFVELEKTLLYNIFKSLKMEKNWERFAKESSDGW